MTVNGQNALFILCVFFTHLVVHYSAEEVRSRTDCPAIKCNDKVGNISFPFFVDYGCYDGLYHVDCSNSSNPKIQLKMGGYWYQLESITRSSSIFINDSNLQKHLEKDNCDDEVFNISSLPSSSPIVNISTSNNVTLFRCNNIWPGEPPYGSRNVACSSSSYTYYTSSQDSLMCPTIDIPIREGFPPNLYNRSALTAQFSFQVQINKECYRCYDKSDGYCVNEDGKVKCANIFQREVNVAGDQNLRLKLGLGIAAIGVVLMITSCCLFWKKQRQNCQNAEAFLRNYGPLQVKRGEHERSLLQGIKFANIIGLIDMLALNLTIKVQRS
ncbi:hypothetical protein M0R45_006313 [Rubus argutus]|uniref:Wall-associated receptor kinase galacturonan-binding domain-containing protein n=1 Tax=Rubus argutus TaxID=59490 RepID=A0AAW1YQ47_RUBAR